MHHCLQTQSLVMTHLSMDLVQKVPSEVTVLSSVVNIWVSVMVLLTMTRRLFARIIATVGADQKVGYSGACVLNGYGIIGMVCSVVTGTTNI